MKYNNLVLKISTLYQPKEIMNCSKLTLALGLLFAASSAMAEGYVIAGIGQANADIDCLGFSCDKNNVGGKIVGGFGFGNGFATEIGYFYYGEHTATAGPATAKARGHSVGVGLAYTAEMGNIQGTIRGGISTNRADVSVNTPGFNFSDNHVSTQPYFGVGLGYKIAKNTSVGLDLDITKFKYIEEVNARLLTLNVRQSF